MTETVRPGQVEWTGDNPFVYLKTDPEADWSSLSLFFRITASIHGRGHLILVVDDPYGDSSETAVRVAFTDNAPLARFLIDDFASKFALFRPSKVMGDIELVEGAEFYQEVNGDTSWVEACRVGGRSAEMRWENIGRAFAVDQPPHESGTGKHEMFSVFRPADSASVSVDGRALSGTTVERAFFGGVAQSAALALSETWVRE